jgi:hypothetical protein
MLAPMVFQVEDLWRTEPAIATIPLGCCEQRPIFLGNDQAPPKLITLKLPDFLCSHRAAIRPDPFPIIIQDKIERLRIN